MKGITIFGLRFYMSKDFAVKTDPETGSTIYSGSPSDIRKLMRYIPSAYLYCDKPIMREGRRYELVDDGKFFTVSRVA